MDQHDHEYPTIQDAVTHAGKLWQTLDKDKLHQEIKEEKEKAYQQHEDLKQHKRDNYNHPRHLPEEQQGSWQGPWRNQTPWQDNRSRDQRPRLSEEERQ